MARSIRKKPLGGAMAGRRTIKDDWRLTFVFILLILAFLTISYRLVRLQVLDYNKYQALANQQRIKKIEIAPRRGTIYDRDMQELAVSIAVDSIYATPYLIEDKEQSARLLAEALGKDPSEIRSKLESTRGFVYIARKVDKAISDKVKALEMPGVGMIEESKRCYPYSSLAAQIIGFAGMDNKGLSGIELYYDKVLRGTPGELVEEKDPMGKPIPGGLKYLAPSSDGNDIILTIDKDIQFKAEEALAAAVTSCGAKSGMLIVMEPANGNILAMANYPSFDPNCVNGVSQELVRNRTVTDLYEPGSTMKVVVASAALQENLVQPQTMFHLPSELKVADRVIGEAHERGAIDLSVADIIIKSSNVGIVKLGQLLQKERLYGYIEKFGLTRPSGIDFPGEVSGLCPKPESWSGSTIGNIPFGQGISVSAMQSLRAMSVVANDGKLVEPCLMQKVRDSEGEAVGAALTKQPETVISVETARTMKWILADVVRRGTGKEAALTEYAVAGKTGTAQKPRQDGKGYEEGKYIASFIGFVPADNPRLSMIVLIDEPKTAIYGGTLAAPPFRDVAEFALRHLKVAPNFVAPE